MRVEWSTRTYIFICLSLYTLERDYNAVQIKFAYAATCHKAQGGQWRNVYVDQGWLPPDGINRSYYRWLYTAFTRATHQVNLVNWPDEQTS